MKTVVILRGLPGAGKTTLLDAFKAHTVISMDLYWSSGDQPYKFDPARIPMAVDWTKNSFLQALRTFNRERTALIVVDNTHSRLWEMQYFIDEAKKEGWVVQIVRVEASLSDCVTRGLHNVPNTKILEMRDRFEDVQGAKMEERLSSMECSMLDMVEIFIDLKAKIDKKLDTK